MVSTLPTSKMANIVQFDDREGYLREKGGLLAAWRRTARKCSLVTDCLGGERCHAGMCVRESEPTPSRPGQPPECTFKNATSTTW